MLELSDDLGALLESRLAPYARALVERSAAYALHLHADEVGPEHLLCTLMEDEECAAHRTVVHAFADPQTVADESRALAAGILVSGSAATLPFSTGAVLALRAARAGAAERGAAQVQVAHVLHAALAALPEDLRAESEEAGYDADQLAARFGEPAAGEGGVPADGALFRAFSEAAKRALSGAARAARQERLDAIGPAHLTLACLDAEPALGRAAGLSASRARVLLRERGVDPTPPTLGCLPPDEAYQAFLEGLSPRAGSIALLARFLAGGTPELARLLARHRINPALLERAQAAFEDPEA